MIRILIEVFKRYPFEQKRLILAAAVGLVGLLLGVRLVIVSDLHQIAGIKSALFNAQKKGTLISEMSGLQGQITAYKEALAPLGQPDWMMEALRRCAEQSGLALVSVSPQNPDKGDYFEKISLLVEAEGGYHQVGSFVERIENFKPFIFLSHLRLEKAEGELPQRRLRIYLQLGAYRENTGAAR